jgi:translation initiation factor 2B subunit (eIF-2B alpha/beta/delta family)
LDLDSLKDLIHESIREQIDDLNRRVEKVVEHGLRHVQEGDRVIVYSVSKAVRRILPAAKRAGVGFHTLVIRRDRRETKQLLAYFRREGIEYTVVPEYGFSHLTSEAAKLFLGAVAVTADGQAVCNAGTANIAGLAHIHQLPVYLFVNSLKISGKAGIEQNIHRKEVRRIEKGSAYKEIIYSHDIIDFSLIDHLIIEDGEIDKQTLSRYMDSS